MNYIAKWLLLFIITFMFSITASGCANKSTEIQSKDPIEAADDQTIIDQWSTIAAPPAPELKSVTVDPKTTALLILDMQTSMSKIPRCAASIPKIQELLTRSMKKTC
jgi:hypothetical protein